MTAPLFETPSVATLPAAEGQDPGTVLAPGETGAAGAPPAEPGAEEETTRVALAPVPAVPVLDFFVFGRPAQQGSKSATMRGGKAVMFEDNKRTEPWRALVVNAARAAMPAGWQRIPKQVGVGVSFVFTFDVPASAPKRRRYWQTTRTSGDVDKIIRSCFDGLTAAGVWHDDSQVVRLVEPFGKFNVGEPEAMAVPGARIRIYALGDAL